MIRTWLAAFLMLATTNAAAETTEPKWTEREVTIGEGDQQLYGSLILPGPWKDEFDAVFFISGSGPTDRDSNQAGMKTDAIKKMALALAEEGIASLRVDKRFSGKSYHEGWKEEDIRFETFVEDGLQWLALLRSHASVKRTFIIGHSEGALVGLLIARRGQVDGYVSLAGIGERASDTIRRQLRDGPSGESVAAWAEPTLEKLENGELDPSPHPVLAQFFRASVQPYLISWFRYDPAVEIKTAPGRTMIVQGTTDIQVRVEDARLLAAARPDATLTIIEGMNHVLRVAPAERAANQATYFEPDLPLAPELMPALLGFMGTP